MNLMDLISHLASNAQQGAGDMGAVLEQLKSLAGISPAQGALNEGIPVGPAGKTFGESLQEASGVVGDTPMGRLGEATTQNGMMFKLLEAMNETPNNNGDMQYMNDLTTSSGFEDAQMDGALALGTGGIKSPVNTTVGRQQPINNLVGGSNATSPVYTSREMGVVPQNMTDSVGFAPGTTLPQAREQIIHANAVRELMNSVKMTGRLPANTPLSLEEISRILNSMPS